MFRIINNFSNCIKKYKCKTIEKSMVESIDLQKIFQQSAEITRISLEENLKYYK